MSGMQIDKSSGNDIFEIYELDEDGCGVRLSMQDAMDVILSAMQRYGLLYKIHSTDGEFIQCALPHMQKKTTSA